MNKEELVEALESKFWVDCAAHLAEKATEAEQEMISINFKDENSRMIAFGLQQYIDGLKEISEFINKLKEDIGRAD